MTPSKTTLFVAALAAIATMNLPLAAQEGHGMPDQVREIREAVRKQRAAQEELSEALKEMRNELRRLSERIESSGARAHQSDAQPHKAQVERVRILEGESPHSPNSPQAPQRRLIVQAEAGKDAPQFRVMKDGEMIELENLIASCEKCKDGAMCEKCKARVEKGAMAMKLMKVHGCEECKDDAMCEKCKAKAEKGAKGEGHGAARVKVMINGMPGKEGVFEFELDGDEGMKEFHRFLPHITEFGAGRGGLGGHFGAGGSDGKGCGCCENCEERGGGRQGQIWRELRQSGDFQQRIKRRVHEALRDRMHGERPAPGRGRIEIERQRRDRDDQDRPRVFEFKQDGDAPVWAARMIEDNFDGDLEALVTEAVEEAFEQLPMDAILGTLSSKLREASSKLDPEDLEMARERLGEAREHMEEALEGIGKRIRARVERARDDGDQPREHEQERARERDRDRDRDQDDDRKSDPRSNWF